MRALLARYTLFPYTTLFRSNRLARDWRPRFIDSLWIACESDPCKLPAFLRLEEIAVSPANMTARSGAGTATQNILVAHELAIVDRKSTRLNSSHTVISYAVF